MDDPEIEAVYVPLPNTLHVEWALKAMAAGKHVLVEKPIAMRAAEIDTLIAARDSSGCFATEAYMIVHHPQWQQARDWVQSGEIGRIEHVDVAFSYDNRADPGNIRNRPETGGGGIRDIGVYAYGSVRWATRSEPVWLRSRLRRENNVDTWAHVIGDFSGPGGGFTYAAMTSMRLHPRQDVVFQGEKGLIRLTAPFNAEQFADPQLQMYRKGQADVIQRFPGAQQYVLQVEAFGRHLREGAAYPWHLEDARGTQTMIDQVFAAEV